MTDQQPPEPVYAGCKQVLHLYASPLKYVSTLDKCSWLISSKLTSHVADESWQKCKLPCKLTSSFSLLPWNSGTLPTKARLRRIVDSKEAMRW